MNHYRIPLWALVEQEVVCFYDCLRKLLLTLEPNTIAVQTNGMRYLLTNVFQKDAAVRNTERNMLYSRVQRTPTSPYFEEIATLSRVQSE